MEGPGFIKVIVSFLAYVAGFAAIPLLARSFTGFLGKWTGMANDKARGFVDKRTNRMRERAQNRTQVRQQKRAMDVAKGLPPDPSRGQRLRYGYRRTMHHRNQNMQRRQAGGYGQPSPGRQARIEKREQASPPTTRAGRFAKRVKDSRLWQKSQNYMEDSRLWQKSQNYMEARREYKNDMNSIAGAKLGAEALKAIEDMQKATRQELIGKDPVSELPEIAMDTTQPVRIRHEAIRVIAEKGLVAPFRDLIKHAQTKGDKTVFAGLGQAQIHPDFYKTFKDSAPDVATMKVERDTLGQVKELKTNPQFLFTASSDSMSQWDLTTIKEFKNLDNTTKVKYPDGQEYEARVLKEKVAKNQVTGILNSPRQRSKLNPVVEQEFEEIRKQYGQL